MAVFINRLKYAIILYLFWVSIFIFAKLFFLLYQFTNTNSFLLRDIIAVFYNGLPMDLSAAGYLMILPVIIIALPLKGRIIKNIMFYYSLGILFIVSWVIVADLELYRYWGYRMDSTALVYLKTPWMIFASLSIGRLILLVFVVFFLFVILIYIYRAKISLLLYDKSMNWKFYPLLMMVFSLIFIPIRGGFDIAPMNIGSVYFHSNPFLNHASVNVLWNLGFSLIDKGQIKDYQYFSDSELHNKIKRLKPCVHDDSIKVLQDNKPNIVFIIMESFTSKLVEPLGGLKGVTPKLNALIDEGLLFSNFYANNSRSDKGMVSIFSAYPSLPKLTVTNYHKKTEKISAIPGCLKDNGYKTAFYYGGDINFANLKGYLINAGYDKLITKDDFHRSCYNSKWGVHDHVMFDTLFDRISRADVPFLYTMFTLSSHEPYDVPMEPVFKGNTELQKYKNTIYYTDSCMGRFIEKAKNTDWWENTLIVLVADHGSRLPGNDPSCFPSKHKIPMLWLGGALQKKDTIISKFGSQVDIAATLLNQLKLETQNFTFSKDLLNPQSPSYAFYFCNKGAGFVNDTCVVVYNKLINKMIYKENKQVNCDKDYAKAILQYVAEDFSKL